MTQEEILEYNKRCAEFLGYVNTTPTDKDFNIYEKENGVVGQLIEVMSMKFHSDWNWIMEVLSSILEKCSDSDDMEAYYNILDLFPQKEAVVQAINQFLIWYNKIGNIK